MSADQSAAVVENLELDLLLEGMFRAYGVDARQCHRPVVEQTISEMVRATGVSTVSALLEKALHDRDYGERAASALECCHLSLFAECDFFRGFKERVVPWLRTHPFISIWIAQCGTGAEVYALAILLEEARLYERTRIYATEEKATALAHARAGVASASCLRFSGANYRTCGGTKSLSEYFEDRNGRPVVNSALRRNIIWSEYSLTTGESFNEFNLVLCCNVVRRLTPGLQRRVYKLITESLPVFGLLGLGLEEAPNISPYVYCYKDWDRGIGFHQRVC